MLNSIGDDNYEHFQKCDLHVVEGGFEFFESWNEVAFGLFVYLSNDKEGIDRSWALSEDKTQTLTDNILCFFSYSAEECCTTSFARDGKKW